AHAGKWREERVQSDGDSLKVARADELKPNQLKLLHTSRGRIVLGRTESGWVAFDDHCTHRGGSLADGVMICGTVQCPWHGSQFDAATGAVRAGPAQQAIKTYSVEERAGDVYLKI
ncbi:MAG: Rieske (2Fe-2S) protein, partial [Gemmatimonadota bacterium]